MATLTLIGVSSAALVVLGSEHVRTTAIRTTVAGDEAAITEFVATELTTADLGSTPLDTERRANLNTSLARLANTHGYRVITLSRLDGSVIASAAGAQDTGDGAARHQPRAPGAQSTAAPETGLKYKDIALLGQMIKGGANLRAPRHAVYYLYFGSREAAEAGAVEGRAGGYSCEVRDPLPAYPDQWSLVCERPDAVLDIDGVGGADDLFEGIADAHAGEFDGWEAAM